MGRFWVLVSTTKPRMLRLLPSGALDPSFAKAGIAQLDAFPGQLGMKAQGNGLLLDWRDAGGGYRMARLR